MEAGRPVVTGAELLGRLGSRWPFVGMDWTGEEQGGKAGGCDDRAYGGESSDETTAPVFDVTPRDPLFWFRQLYRCPSRGPLGAVSPRSLRPRDPGGRAASSSNRARALADRRRRGG